MCIFMCMCNNFVLSSLCFGVPVVFMYIGEICSTLLCQYKFGFGFGCNTCLRKMMDNLSENVQLLLYMASWNTNIILLTHRGRAKMAATLQTTLVKCIFNDNVRTSNNFSPKFVLKYHIDNFPALVHRMAGRQPRGDKALSEPTMFSLLKHIYLTRPQWVNCPIYNQ